MVAFEDLPAEVFAPSLAGGRAPGRLWRGAGQLHFEAAGFQLEWSLGEVAVRLGGFDDRMVFFTHPAAPGVEVASEDPRVIEAFADLPAVALAVGRRRGGRSRFWGCAIVAAVAIAARLIAGWFGWRHLVKELTERISPEIERKIGDLAKTAAGIGDLHESEALATLAAPLTSRRSAYSWRLFLVPDPTVNAFALPGGTIVVHCGLVKALEPEALLGVLAHEVGHVEGRHGLRAMVAALGLRTLAALVFGDPAGFEGLLLGLGTNLAELSYSRELEEAADDRGLALLREAGLGGAPLIAALEALASLETGAAGAPAFLSSHPHPTDRARRLAGHDGARRLGSSPVDRGLVASLHTACEGQ